MNTKLVPKTRADVRAMIDSMSAYQRKQISADWLARFEATADADPWVFGFNVVLQDSAEVVGNCGFKGPPVDGMVEIAYGISPEQQGKGYATEATRALIDFARGTGEVRLIRAHTMPESNASGHILRKCGLARVGEVIDPEDGLVWRFEMSLEKPSG